MVDWYSIFFKNYSSMEVSARRSDQREPFIDIERRSMGYARESGE